MLAAKSRELDNFLGLNAFSLQCHGGRGTRRHLVGEEEFKVGDGGKVCRAYEGGGLLSGLGDDPLRFLTGNVLEFSELHRLVLSALPGLVGLPIRR